ncbi:uncharacterized protein LOC144746103 [Ciona intestinalis]
MTLSPHSIEKLIEEIRAQPDIYDVKCPKYSNRDFQDISWKKIAAEIGYDVNTCKKQWTTLRNTYVQNLRENKVGPSDSGTSMKCQWYLADKMSFLQPFIKHRSMSGNVSIAPPTPTVPVDIDLTCNEQPSPEEFYIEAIPAEGFEISESNELVCSSTPVSDMPAKKDLYRKQKADKKDEVDIAVLEFLKSKSTAGQDQGYYFAMSLIPHFNRMEYKKYLKVQWEIIRLIEQYID